MAKYHLTNKAVEDLTNIWEYTVDTWSERQADDYYNMLIASFQKITENPRLFGLKYEEIAEGLRGYRANKHVIFYRILADKDILVIRILHQRMDLKHRVLED
jgi:toxin ParE1/3/4